MSAELMTTALDEEIFKLHRQGKSYAVIAHDFGLNLYTVGRSDDRIKARIKRDTERVYNEYLKRVDELRGIRPEWLTEEVKASLGALGKAKPQEVKAAIVERLEQQLLKEETQA